MRLKVYDKGYSDVGASRTRRALKSFVPNSASPREDIDANVSVLRQRSRMLYMAAPLATSAINTNRTKIVGTGLKFKSTINADILGITAEQAKEWQRKTELEFALWANKQQNCDATGVNSFVELQQLAVKSWLMSGDVFALLLHEEPTPLNPYGLRIRLVEADRICTPQTTLKATQFCTNGVIPAGEAGAGNSVYDGVEVNKSGKIIAYHICRKYPQSGYGYEKAEWDRVLAYGENTGLPNVLQIMDSERVDQYRGVPYLAQVIEPLLQLRRYTESELMAALVQSFFTAWIETETTSSDFPLNEVGAGDVEGFDGTYSVTADNMSDSENEYEMSPGTVTHLAKGEKITFGNPNVPTAGFKTFTDTLAKHIGAALEIPFDVLVKEFDASYSASRAALLEAWEAIKMRRTWLTTRFCQPVYEVWLSEAVARGRIKAPGFFDNPLYREAWCGARWIGPVQGQLDPKKEIEAAIRATECAVKTHEQITLEQGGGDWEANAEQLKYENKLLVEAKSEQHTMQKGGSTT